MYKTILFDLDDTLIDFQSSQHKSLKRLHAEFYSDIDFALFEQTYRPINRALWEQLGSTSITADEIKAKRFVEIHKALNIEREANRVADAFEQLLGETTEWLPHVKPVIEFLHQKNHTLGIVTNGLQSAQLKKYERCELHKWFDAFIVSETVGIAKPNKKIFDITLSNISTTTIDRESVLMVGDSLSHDGQGAKNAGLHFCFVNRLALELNHDTPPIKHHITSVAELPAVLGYRLLNTRLSYPENGSSTKQLNVL